MMRGFTLVEVVVALVILEIGALGVVGTLLLASRTLGEAELRERAVLETLRVFDSLVVDGAAGPGSRERPWGQLFWTVGDGERPGRVLAMDVRGDTLVAVELPPGP